MFSKKLSTARGPKHKISQIPAGLSDAAMSAAPGLSVCAHLFCGSELSRVPDCASAKKNLHASTHAQPTVSSCQDGFVCRRLLGSRCPCYSHLFPLSLPPSLSHPLFSSHAESTETGCEVSGFRQRKKKRIVTVREASGACVCVCV